LVYYAITAMAAFFYLGGHWLFAFRYFEVAEMLRRKDKSIEAHLKARRITFRITIGVIVFLVIAVTGNVLNSVFYAYARRLYSDIYTAWVGAWIPLALLLIMCVLLLIALRWIY